MSEPADFLPIVVRRGLRGSALTGPETRKWTLNRQCALNLGGGAVTGVTFSPLFPHDVAAASGPSISIIDPQLGSVRRSLARFRDVAHCPDYKPDGRLLAAGCKNGTVQVFDLSSRVILRTFRANQFAVYSSRFTADGLRIMSGSDDGVVRAWDLATSSLLFTLRGSADYVRAQASSPASKHIWSAGSYDGKARVYDLRTRETLFTLDHGSQVDEVLLLPGGARAVTIGGADIKLWDFFAGGKMVTSVRSHAKAVTCGALSFGGDRLLTGGLDGQVKVHDITTMDIVSSMFFGAQILTLAASPQVNRIAVGLIDGTVDVRVQKRGVVLHDTRDTGDQVISLCQQSGKLKETMFEGWGRGFEKQRKSRSRSGTKRYLLRGPKVGICDSRDFAVGGRRRVNLKEYDVLLRKFCYGEALDSALKTRKARVAVSMVDELIVRGGLRTALSGRSNQGISLILSLIAKKIGDPRYAAVLTQLTEALLDMYGDVFGVSADNDSPDKSLVRILKKVKREIFAIKYLYTIDGMLAVIGSARPVDGSSVELAR